MLVYYFVPFIVSNRYLLFWVSNGHNSVIVQNRTHVCMNFFDHKDLGNHLLQLCPKVVKHPVYPWKKHLHHSNCMLQLQTRNTIILLKQNVKTVSNFDTDQHNNISMWLFLSSKLFDVSATAFKAIHLVCAHHPSYYTGTTTYTRVYLWAKYNNPFLFIWRCKQLIIVWDIPIWHIYDKQKYEQSQICNTATCFFIKHIIRQCKIFTEILSHTKQNNSL